MSSKRVSARGRGSFLSVTEGSPTPKTGTPEKKKSERAKISLEIRSDFHRELKKRAASTDRKMYELVDEALSKYLESATA